MLTTVVSARAAPLACSTADLLVLLLLLHPSLSTYPLSLFSCTLLLSNDIRCTSIGVLSCLDGYMNIALEQTEEYVNGVLTNSYGDAFVRGNNGEF